MQNIPLPTIPSGRGLHWEGGKTMDLQVRGGAWSGGESEM